MIASDIKPQLKFSNDGARFRVIFPVKGKPGMWHVEQHTISSTFLNRRKNMSSMIIMSEDDIIELAARYLGDSMVRDIQTIGAMAGERATNKSSKWRYALRFSGYHQNGALA